MIYGYIRVSSDKQTVENQRFEIKNFCDNQNIKIDGWIEETISGTKAYNKRELGKLLNKVQKDDLIICAELSRLGRNLFMIMEILNICMSKECRVWTIKDNYKLGEDIQSKVLAFAFGLSAEIERNLISQRTKEALARKKIEGIINTFTDYIAQIDLEIKELINQAPVIAHQMDLLMSVDGVGERVALKMIMETDAFTSFTDPRKFCCHAVFLLNIFGSVPFRQVGVHFIFGKGGINMFLAVIIELADTHLRHLVLPCISPYPFGIDLIFLCNLLGGVILGDVKVVFCYQPFIRFAFEHEFDVGFPYQRHLSAEPGGT
jgi:DNA invertase Pin-like site-specific DNA recombinase